MALLVSKNYVIKPVPIEEARIAIAKHSGNGSVIPIYMDDAVLPQDMFNPMENNYFKSNNPAEIANHLATKLRRLGKINQEMKKAAEIKNIMSIENNRAEKQVFIRNFEGNINL